jgi:apolipoprotein D and lipocalin family protein
MKPDLTLRITITIVVAFLAGCATQSAAPLPTVESVDLARYVGAWYEIALLPNGFQSQCVADTQARYRRDGDVIRVTNRCRKSDGSLAEINGVAKIVEGSGNTKLRVSFFRPFYGDYWVLALDPDYQWVLVGEPRRKFGWVLARTPKLDEGSLKRALDRADELGFKQEEFHRTPQTRPLD